MLLCVVVCIMCGCVSVISVIVGVHVCVVCYVL